MNGLPEAGPEIRDFFLRWLETFSGFVRDVDYASAKPLFHEDILAFGTHRDVLPSLEAWVNSQWDNVWPRTDDFRFDRPGRATLIFHHQNGKWLGIHSHLSLNRGVPQASHGNRPVKVR